MQSGCPRPGWGLVGWPTETEHLGSDDKPAACIQFWGSGGQAPSPEAALAWWPSSESQPHLSITRTWRGKAGSPRAGLCPGILSSHHGEAPPWDPTVECSRVSNDHPAPPSRVAGGPHPPARARSPWARPGNLRACASNQAPGSRTGAPDPATGPGLEQPSLRGLSFSSGRGTAQKRRWESAGSARLSRPIRGRPRPRGRAPPAPGRPGQGRVASRAG